MRVVIVGSGLIGLLTAYYLRKHGAEVCVLERQEGPGLETSFANGGMLHASQANPWNAPGILSTAIRMMGHEDSPLLFRKAAVMRLLPWGFKFWRHSTPARYAANIERNTRLARHSLALMREIRDEQSLDYDFAPKGTLTIYRSAAALDAAAGLAEVSRSHGITCDVVDAHAAIHLEPALGAIGADIVGATHFPDDESGDAYKFCDEIHRVCAAEGVEFHFNTPVDRIEMHNRAAVGVQCSSGSLAAEAVVIAAGSYTPILARTAGLRVPVQPVKGYSITVPVGQWEGAPLRPVIDEQQHAAVCPLGDRLRVAGTAEFAGYDVRLTESRINNLFAMLRALYPEFAPYLDVNRVQAWTGLRPMTPDGVGIMGRTPVPGLYLNTGHGHLGWTMAAAAGQAVAHEIVREPGAFDLRDYRLENR